MILRLGDQGANITELQKLLDKAGFWDKDIAYTKEFDAYTDKKVREFQTSKELLPDGKVGPRTLALLNNSKEKSFTRFDETYKDKIIQGSHFPGAPILKYNISLNKEMRTEYVPLANEIFKDTTKGLQLLCTIMAYKEGFRVGTRSYRTNNPGNIGNTDSGANKSIRSLKDGIMLQRIFVLNIIKNGNKNFPLGKKVRKKPFFSEEIAKNSKVYGMSPYLPGYEFIFTGQLDQFVKIYSTGARGGNTYLSMIISFFAQNGYIITPETKLQDIIKLN